LPDPAFLTYESVPVPSVADPHQFDPDPDPACHSDADLDSTFHFDEEPESFQIKDQNLEKKLK
jgi:hypothetical protein